MDVNELIHSFLFGEKLAVWQVGELSSDLSSHNVGVGTHLRNKSYFRALVKKTGYIRMQIYELLLFFKVVYS